MPENVKRRLVLENDERVYSSRDLLPICEALDIPLVLDFHHYNIYPDGQPVEIYSLGIKYLGLQGNHS